MSTKKAALATAVAGVIFGSASVSLAAGLNDTFNDGNPLTINGTPTYTAFSFNSGNAYTQPDPTNFGVITAGPNTIAETPAGTAIPKLTMSVSDTSNDGSVLETTSASSAYNFWQHPVQITVNAPTGGNLMPTGTSAANQSILYIGLTAGQERLDTGNGIFYLQLSNSDTADKNVTTQYDVKGTNTDLGHDATPTFGGGGFPAAIPYNGTVTSITLYLDGSTYNRSTNTGDLFFNWGATFITPGGVTETYWRYNSSPGAYSYQIGPRKDVAFGASDAANGGFALLDNTAALYDAWTAAGVNPIDGLVGDSFAAVEFKQNSSGPAPRGPSQVSIGSLVAGDPTAVTEIPGDANGDGKVDSSDFFILVNNFGLTGTNAGPSVGDFNSDTNVDSSDFFILVNNFGFGTGGGASSADLASVIESDDLLTLAQKASFLASVPEPTSLGLLAAAPLLALRRRRVK